MYHRPGVVPDGDTKVIEDFRPSELCLPCVGGGGTPLGVTEGVYGSNLVGVYRTVAFSESEAYTPSVTGFGP